MNPGQKFLGNLREIENLPEQQRTEKLQNIVDNFCEERGVNEATLSALQNIHDAIDVESGIELNFQIVARRALMTRIVEMQEKLSGGAAKRK